MAVSNYIVIKRSIYLGWLAFIAAVGGFLFGFDTAVISGTLSLVTEQFGTGPLWEGWFVSSAILGCIAGVAFAGKLSDSAGRKKVMLLSSVFFFISGVGCALSGEKNGLILFRFIGGMGVGVASILCPMYISEISPAGKRGSLVALYQLGITIGILSAYFSNALLLDLSGKIIFQNGLLSWIVNQEVWRAMFGMYIIPAALFFFLLLLIPESPRWLAVRGKDMKAMAILTRINDTEKAAWEMEQIQAVSREKKGDFRLLFTGDYRLPLVIGLLLPLLSQFSGINAVIYYGPRILEKAGFLLSEALGGQVTIGIINVLFTLLAIFTVDRWGRKPLLMLGIGGATLALISCGLLFALGITRGPWILLSILVYIACFAFSIGAVAWVIIGEIFPNNIRGRAMSLATFSLWTGCFIVGQITPLMLKHVGAPGTFWTFALLCLPAFWLTWKLIPETRGKTLEEIEQSWKKGKDARE